MDNAEDKDGFLGQIWSISTTLTDEAMKAGLDKATASNYDINRGLIPLTESFINLGSARATLEDAIEKDKLVQLPITVQKEILANLENISKCVLGLMNGGDEIITFTSAVETLNTTIWKYGLHNLSEQVLGYQRKLNQIKTQEVKISQIIYTLDRALKKAEEVESDAAQTRERSNEIAGLLENLKQNFDAAVVSRDSIKEIEGKTIISLSAVQQSEKQTGESTAAVKTAFNEMLSLDASVRRFYGEVEDYRRKIAETTDNATKMISESEASVKTMTKESMERIEKTISDVQSASKLSRDEVAEKTEILFGETRTSLSNLDSDLREKISDLTSDTENKVDESLKELQNASISAMATGKEFLGSLKDELNAYSEETIGTNTRRTQELVRELERLKEQVREQIQQATGFTLFGAFQARQNQIAQSKRFWVYSIATLVLISAGVTAWIAYEAQSYSVHSFAFWVKLSLTIPVGFALTFCTVQYSRERRLEEEYAFKSSISVSLNPYRDLVHSILEKDEDVDKNKYTDFVIDSVSRVFSSPMERIFGSEHGPDLTKKALKDAAELLGTAVKATKG
jgi:hypothetical protein